MYGVFSLQKDNELTRWKDEKIRLGNWRKLSIQCRIKNRTFGLATVCVKDGRTRVSQRTFVSINCLLCQRTVYVKNLRKSKNFRVNKLSVVSTNCLCKKLV